MDHFWPFKLSKPTKESWARHGHESCSWIPTHSFCHLFLHFILTNHPCPKFRKCSFIPWKCTLQLHLEARFDFALFSGWLVLFGCSLLVTLLGVFNVDMFIFYLLFFVFYLILFLSNSLRCITSAPSRQNFRGGGVEGGQFLKFGLEADIGFSKMAKFWKTTQTCNE